MPMTEKQWTTLARDLRRAVARVSPEWTDYNVHDPGNTILELISYTLDQLRYRSGALDGRAGELSRTVVERAIALAAWTAGREGNECGPGLQRVNYASGMLLGVDEFSAEQDYVRDRMKRRNRLLYGAGIAAGLGVTVERNATGSRITIAPGLAFDPMGNEICVEEPADLALPPQGKDLLVLLRYAERPCRFVPVVAGTTSDAEDDRSSTQATRIVESFTVALAAAPAADAVSIASLRHVRGRWRPDRSFKAMRVEPEWLDAMRVGR